MTWVRSTATTRPTFRGLNAGHVGGVFFGIAVEPQHFPPHLWIPRALELIDAVHEQARRHPQDMEVAYTADDIRRIHRAGRIAALMGVEGGHMIQNSLAVLRDYYRLGVRYMTLTHFKTNEWADSSSDVAVHNGLTAFGRDIVREMNRLGMMVDISHVSDKTFYDALETSTEAHDRVALLAARLQRHSAQHERRYDSRAGEEGRRGVYQLQHRVSRQEGLRRFARNRDQRDRDIADMMALNAAIRGAGR